MPDIYQTSMGVARTVCLAVLIVLLTNPVLGQQAGNRLMLETGGPVGTVRSLRFSSNSQRLYAAGIDQQVHVWDLYGGPDGKLAPQHIQYLRWEVSRADRGAIYATDICPRGRIAFGGYSGRGNSGDIVVYDAGMRFLNRVLPATRPGPQGVLAANGHLAPIIGVSFAPSGNRLASMDINGVTRVWGTEEQNRQLRSLEIDSDFQSVAFLDDDHVAVAMPVNWRIVEARLRAEQNNTEKRKIVNQARNGRWQIGVFEADGGKLVRTIGKMHHGGVTAIARDPFQRGRWASADAQGRLIVYDNIDGKRYRELDLWQHAIKAAEVRSIRFGPGDQLLVSTGYRPPTNLRSAQLVLIDLKPAKPVVEDTVVVSSSVPAHACAISPDGKLAAVAAGEAQDVWLFPLTNLNRLDKANRVTLSSQGRRFQKVAFAKSNRSSIVLSSSSSGEFELGFDFSKSEFLRGEQVPEPHSPTRGDWKLTADDQNLELTVSNQATHQHWRINLDAKGQGLMNSFCWLPDQTGRVYGIAIGTAQQNGIFVYRFEDAAEGRLVRYYRDHRGPITSLSVSHDGAYLASCSHDQTIKVWSLRGLQEDEDDGQSPKARGWGGKFLAREGQLTVSGLDENGILFQRDFDDGAVIERIAYRSERSLKTAATPEAMLQFLRDRELWDPVSFKVRDREDEIEIYSGWQPLLTLFVSNDNSWAVWTPQGYYDASVLGDEFFGWVHNRGRDKAPGYYRAAHMRPELEKPPVIRELLASGQLSDAFRKVGLELPDNYRNPVPNLLGQAPSVRIIEPIDGMNTAGNQSIVVNAEVLYAALQDNQQFQIKAFVNQSYSLPVEAIADAKRNSIRYKFMINSNDLNALVQVKLFDLVQHNQTGLHHVRHQDWVGVRQDPVRGVAGRRLKKLRVHFVGIGGSGYHSDGEKVRGCQDIKDLHRQLAALQKESEYELAEPLILLDEEVTPQNLADKLKQKQDIENDDLLIVFLAGHGNYDNKYGFYFVPAIPEIENAIKPPAEQIKKYCIRRDTLEPLARMNCRRLFIVDTCHAGKINQSLKNKEKLKKQVSDWMSQSILVYCSAQADQAAFDGEFTRRLIAAIDGAADRVQRDDVDAEKGETFVAGDRDGYVTLLETESYVNKEFAGGPQEPRLFKEPGARSLLSLRLFKNSQGIP